ncbi:Nn.00g016350.m01.CDS01 [Neocucurbitaria sp. VM-36]
MPVYSCPNAKHSACNHPIDQLNNKPEVTILPNVNEIGYSTRSEAHVRRKYYTPAELRSPVLIAFCIVVLTVFTLLQLAAAAFSGAPSLHALTGRSIDSASDCPLGATCVPAPGSWSNPDASPSPTPSIAPGAPGPGSWTSTIGWTKVDYFVGTYLPTLAAILFSIWWKCIFARLKEMEPFYQMTRTGGATAQDSLLLSYPRASMSKVLLSSWNSGHWLSFLGAMNMGLITICALFASETLFISSKGEACYVIVDPTSDTNNDCQMQLSMRPPLAWALSIVLLAVVMLTIVVLVLLRRRASGIYAEATSIAGIACLYNGTLVQDPAQSLRDRSRRFVLAPSPDNGTNSIVELESSTVQSPPYPQLRSGTVKKKSSSHPSIHPASLATFWLFLVAVLIWILYYRFVSKPGTGNALETFMDSQSFGVRLFMTVLGLLIKFYWGWIEQYIRSVGPYMALSSPHGATAEQSLLVRSPSHPVTALFYMDSWRHVLLGIVTVMAVLSEVLVISLNALPFSTAKAYVAFELSAYISIGILVAMIVTVLAVLIWKMVLGRHVEFEEVPECIADLFVLLSDATNWSVFSMLGDTERNQALRGWQVRFALQKAQGTETTNAEWRIVTVGPAELSM